MEATSCPALVLHTNADDIGDQAEVASTTADFRERRDILASERDGGGTRLGAVLDFRIREAYRYPPECTRSSGFSSAMTWWKFLAIDWLRSECSCQGDCAAVPIESVSIRLRFQKGHG